MSTIRDVEIENALLTGQQEFRKGTTLPDLALPEDDELARAMTAGWLRCFDRDPRNFGCDRRRVIPQ